MDKTALLDLATEATRKYGNLPSDFPEKMKRRIKRKFSINVEIEKISELSYHFKEIYNLAKSILPNHINKDTRGEYANPQDINSKSFFTEIAEKYPDDDNDILEKIINWAIYYEYLR
jgi:hypothetical protein